ncbi:hypothetical protein ACKLNO_03900 [Neisseriaceae bacterium B1]
MNIYHVYLPSHTHDDLHIVTITHQATRNQTLLQEDGKSEQHFYSVTAALAHLHQRYPNAYMEAA